MGEKKNPHDNDLILLKISLQNNVSVYSKFEESFIKKKKVKSILKLLENSKKKWIADYLTKSERILWIELVA